MATNYPTSLDTTTELPDISNTSNTTDVGKVHSTITTNVNQAVRAVETKLGITNSSDATSVDFLLRSIAGGSIGARLGGASSVGATSVSTRIALAAIRSSRIILDPYTTDAEVETIASVSGTTVNLASALTYAHAADDPVLLLPRQAYNVEWFGAIGDGTTDSTTALTRAFAAAANDGTAVYIPPGVFITNSPLTYVGGVPVFGDGYNSVLKAGSTFSGTALLLNTADVMSQPYIGFLRLECNSKCGGIFNTKGSEQSVIERVVINGYNATGIYQKTDGALANTTQQENLIVGCLLNGDGSTGTVGIRTGDGCTDGWYINNLVKSNEDCGYYLEDASFMMMQCHSYIGVNNNSGGKGWAKTALRLKGSGAWISQCQLNSEYYVVEMNGSGRYFFDQNTFRAGIRTVAGGDAVDSAVFRVISTVSNVRISDNDMQRANRWSSGTVTNVISGVSGVTMTDFRIEDNVIKPSSDFGTILQSKVEATATYPGGSASSFTTTLGLLGSASDSRIWLCANANLGALWWSYNAGTRTLTINCPTTQAGTATVSVMAMSGRTASHTF